LFDFSGSYVEVTSKLTFCPLEDEHENVFKNNSAARNSKVDQLGGPFSYYRIAQGSIKILGPVCQLLIPNCSGSLGNKSVT